MSHHIAPFTADITSNFTGYNDNNMYKWTVQVYHTPLKSSICHSLYALKTFTHRTTRAHSSSSFESPQRTSEMTTFCYPITHISYLCITTTLETVAVSASHSSSTAVAADQVWNVEHFRFLTHTQLCGARFGPTTIQKNPRGISSRILGCLSPILVIHRLGQYQCTLCIKLSSQSSTGGAE